MFGCIYGDDAEKVTAGLDGFRDGDAIFTEYPAGSKFGLNNAKLWAKPLLELLVCCCSSTPFLA